MDNNKTATRWYSQRLQQDIALVRWGHWGAPLLLFPTAGGDAEEIERQHLIGVLGDLIDAGRVKVYSLDSVPGRALVDKQPSGHVAWLQNQFDAAIYHEVVAAIRSDCRDAAAEVIAAGASIGAFNAVASLCRHPDAFRAAIAMSGTYDLTPILNGPFEDALYFCSPLHYLPGLADDAPQLVRLRQRFALLAFGQGRWEAPHESWQMAKALGERGVPNRVDAWGGEWDHDWPTWRAMLPRYLEELL